MKSKQLILMLLTCLMMSVGIAQTTKPQNNIYTEDKTSIAVSRSQPTFTLKLKSNPTTGFSWFLREYDANLITPVKHSYEQGTPGLIGSPGYELWVFKVKPAAFVVPQQTSIRLMYARPWESNDSGSMIAFKITTQ